MSKYKCHGCPVQCKCEIPDECDFVPSGCLDREIEKSGYDAEWVEEVE